MTTKKRNPRTAEVLALISDTDMTVADVVRHYRGELTYSQVYNIVRSAQLRGEMAQGQHLRDRKTAREHLRYLLRSQVVKMGRIGDEMCSRMSIEVMDAVVARSAKMGYHNLSEAAVDCLIEVLFEDKNAAEQRGSGDPKLAQD